MSASRSQCPKCKPDSTYRKSPCSEIPTSAQKKSLPSKKTPAPDKLDESIQKAANNGEIASVQFLLVRDSGHVGEIAVLTSLSLSGTNSERTRWRDRSCLAVVARTSHFRISVGAFSRGWSRFWSLPCSNSTLVAISGVFHCDVPQG
jgi:hypothetical protein